MLLVFSYMLISIGFELPYRANVNHRGVLEYCACGKWCTDKAQLSLGKCFYLYWQILHVNRIYIVPVAGRSVTNSSELCAHQELRDLR